MMSSSDYSIIVSRYLFVKDTKIREGLSILWWLLCLFNPITCGGGVGLKDLDRGRRPFRTHWVSKLNADTFRQFLNIPIDQFKPIK